MRNFLRAATQIATKLASSDRWQALSGDMQGTMVDGQPIADAINELVREIEELECGLIALPGAEGSADTPIANKLRQISDSLSSAGTFNREWCATKLRELAEEVGEMEMNKPDEAPL